MENELLKVGYDKGEVDFSVNSGVYDLSYEQMNEFRAMIIVAIGTMEALWRSKNHGNASQHSQEG